MIPKIIHQIWLGSKPIPDHIVKYMKKVEEVLPDYDIRVYRDGDLDFSDCEFALEAFKNNHPVFTVDYLSWVLLQKHGGIYLDTDIEVLKDFGELLESRSFIGKERPHSLNHGVLGYEPNHEIVNEMIDIYKSMKFPTKPADSNLPVSTGIISRLYKRRFGRLSAITRTSDYLDKDVILPVDMLVAMDWETRQLKITDRTICIHRFEGSWLEKNMKEV